jgi:hypothetical protein
MSGLTSPPLFPFLNPRPELQMAYAVVFSYIDGILDHHCLNIPFIMIDSY